MSQTPFYASGLKFSCKRCSACCRYESGYVFLSAKDLESLTVHFKMDMGGFVKTYCRWAFRGEKECLSLREKSNFDCIFWDSSCTVYNSRPLQCRVFPFWQTVLASKAAWEMTAGDCPGMNCGEFHDKNAVFSYLELQAARQLVEKQYYTEQLQNARGI